MRAVIYQGPPDPKSLVWCAREISGDKRIFYLKAANKDEAIKEASTILGVDTSEIDMERVLK